MLHGRTFWRAVIGVAAAVLGSFPALAGSLTVFPVRVQLSADEPVQTLTVRNSGGEPSRVQLRVYAWSQAAGEEVLAETREVLANPPLFEIAPGDEQLARLGLRASAGDVERSYRVILEEVPIDELARPGEVRALLRISIPIFVPPAAARVQLDWSARPSDGALMLGLANGGNTHVQISRLTITRADGSPLGAEDMSVYLLPGARTERSFAVSLPVRSGERLRIEVLTDSDPLSAEIVAGGSSGEAGRP
ncbi:MAG: molecular chaperone [Sphingomonadaceae bacterium]|nr:molecular chaperone [Sphingomonadaceae bacterium]